MGDPSSGPPPGNDGAGPQERRAWVQANFTQIFGTSAEDLQAKGIDPRRYAMEHREEVRRFARQQRSQGISVPGGRPAGNRGYGYGGGGRPGIGRRGGSAWIGVLIALFALRFLLVDSFAGAHAAVFWVLGIGGILLVARVLLFSWLRNRRFNRRQSGGQHDTRSGAG
jgi:hypothetical protein